MYQVIKLNDSHIPLLKEFCLFAGLAGYANNASIEAMKFGSEYDMGEIPEFWGVVADNRLISVSGSHHWKDDDGQPTMMRCLFRSATLPGYDKIVPGLNRYHMNSLPFSALLPHQINTGLKNGVNHFYITTSNSNHDASGKMKRTHKVLHLLEKVGIVKYAGDEVFYSTSQTKWELHLDNYLEALRGFHPVRTNLGFEASRDYLDIIHNGFSRPWGGFCTPLTDDLDTQTNYLYTKYSHQY